MRAFRVVICLILINISLISIIPLSESRAHVSEYIKESEYLIRERYLYRFYENYINIIDIGDYDRIEELSSIYYPLSKIKLYLIDNRLFISGIFSEDGVSYLDVSIYDVSDKSSPYRLSNFRFSSYDYMFKEHNGVIYLCTQVDDVNMNIISLDLNKENIFFSLEEFEGKDNNFMYLFDDSIYVICNDDMIDRHFTTIYKFDLYKDNIKYVNKICFDGSIIDDRFISGYEGNLRILVCCEDHKNKIYIFDKDLNSINSIDIILDNTNITNIYFDGYVCYISSFMKEGYLHIYDLSNNNPKEVSRIKLSSSCDILYKLSHDKFLVIGNEYRVDTYKNSQNDKAYDILKNIGVKVNFIDMSNISNPILLDYYLIRGKDMYSKDFINSRYFIYSKDSNILALRLNSVNNNIEIDINGALEVYNKNTLHEGIYVFNLDDHGGINLRFILGLDDGLLEFEKIEIIGEAIFIFNIDSMYIINLEGKLLSEYEFTKREACENVSLSFNFFYPHILYL